MTLNDDTVASIEDELKRVDDRVSMLLHSMHTAKRDLEVAEQQFRYYEKLIANIRRDITPYTIKSIIKML
ncbi:MAG: hypothetical protein M1481_02120 [Candidatus Thermoplasmatota archaeon]|nr:hypothetical protein [Candidatus Thermoplasmatota archaeon]MCL5963597.1 hypothetical protein [Candidatus Thermoplasmatota archaeon]